MTKTSAYNVGVGMTVALGSFSYGFGFATFATSIGQYLNAAISRLY